MVENNKKKKKKERKNRKILFVFRENPYYIRNFLLISNEKLND